MFAWTDYPITELEDNSYTTIPIRRCEILSYDGNKYCKVSFIAPFNRIIVKEIKAGYLYRSMNYKPNGSIAQKKVLLKDLKELIGQPTKTVEEPEV